MRNFGIAIIWLLLAGSLPASAVDFATKRLQSIAKCLSLPGIERLNNQTSYDYKYRNRTLAVHANRYGEIDHIGLALFPEEMKALVPSPVYNFLERNLLERQLTKLDEELQFRMKNDHLTFVVGQPSTVLSFNGTEQFAEEHIDLKHYRVTWTRDGREVLKISFDMDIEMLSGCNSIELEDLFIRRLKRQQPLKTEGDIVFFPEKGNEFVAEGDTFHIREMRNDLYFERKGGKEWQLTNSPAAPSKTLSNMMLSTQFPASPTVRLTVDKYGYKTDSLTLPYRNLLSLAIEDGCTPYFGIKERTEDGGYTGTLILVNRLGGYVHMLAVEVPAETLRNSGEGTISGRLYVYIPMHNVSDKFFQRSTNPKPAKPKKKKTIIKE